MSHCHVDFCVHENEFLYQCWDSKRLLSCSGHPKGVICPIRCFCDWWDSPLNVVCWRNRCSSELHWQSLQIFFQKSSQLERSLKAFVCGDYRCINLSQWLKGRTSLAKSKTWITVIWLLRKPGPRILPTVGWILRMDRFLNSYFSNHDREAHIH